ncbi:MAG: hypothetical protein PHG06_17315 [Parabacteroides sp.]|nr:hypothetical protein [Parabacteroides sp.]
MARNLALEKKWEVRFEEYKQSGLSIKAWCAKNGFKATTFHYWIKKFKESKQIAPIANAQFAEVVLEPCNTNNTIESKKLNLSYGSYKIDIADGFNLHTLAELLKVLQRL